MVRRSLARLPSVPAEFRQELPYLAAIFFLSFLMLTSAALGTRPIGGDHAAHFFRFWYFCTHLLPEGKLFGWSNLWFAGHPVGYLYPFFAYVWCGLVYVAGLGLFTLENAYAIGLFVAHFTVGYSVYRFGAYAFSRPVGLLAAALCLTDLGSAKHAGGWYFDFYVGVWPNVLSIAFSTLALTAFLGALSKRSFRQVGWFGFLAGLALITHPIQLLNLTVLVSTAFILEAIQGKGRRILALATITLIAILCAALVSAIWLFPFLSAKMFSASDGKPWMPFLDMCSHLLQGSLFDGMWAYSSMMGLIGSLYCLGSRSVPAQVVGCLVFGYLFLGSTEGLSLVGTIIGSNLSLKVEGARFGTLLRPFWFVGAAAISVAMFSRFAERFRLPTISNEGGHFPTFKRFFRTVTVSGTVRAGLAFLFIIPLAFEYYHFKIDLPLAHYTTDEVRNRSELAKWINAKAAEGPEFFRVALLEDFFDARLVDLGTELSVPTYKSGWTPAAVYRFRLGDFTPDTLEALSVRYVVSNEAKQLTILKIAKEMYDSGLEPSPDVFTPIASFGELRITQYNRWNPSRFKVIQGHGNISEVSFKDEEIILTAQPGASGVLRLNVSFFDRWQATRNGIPVELKFSQIEGDIRTAFITTRLEPGRYVFSFVRQWPEILGPIITILGVIACLGLIIFGDRIKSIRNANE